MRHLIITLFLISISIQAQAQIRGNGKIAQKLIDLKDLKSIDIQFNADIVLDFNQAEQMTLSTDKNVIEWVGIEFKNGHLTIDQIQWIEPSKQPTITIGCPQLKSVYQGTHSSTNITNIKANAFEIGGNVGRIIGDGIIENLIVNTTGTDIDFSKVDVSNAKVIIDDDSKVILDKVDQLEKSIVEDSRLIVLSENDNTESNKKTNRKNLLKDKVNPDAKYIKFKIKNNSVLRNHFVVVGPKPKGGKFSYGFSMMPGFKKSENWTTGTKIYKEKKSGKLELLVTIKAEDENSVVDLF